MLTRHATTAKGDVLVEMDTEFTFHALVDPDAYSGFIGEWTCKSLADVVLRHMNHEKLLAWGCPHGKFTFEIRRGKPSRSVPHRQFEGCIETGGRLSLTTFRSMAMCAQFDDATLPDFQDYCFEVGPGRYRVTVQQFFRWNGKGQLPEDEYPNDVLEPPNYVISIQPAKGARRITRSRIPLALVMYELVGA